MRTHANALSALLITFAMGCYQPIGARNDGPLGRSAEPTNAQDAGEPDIVEVDTAGWNVLNQASVVDVALEGELGNVRADGDECWVARSNNVCYGNSLSVDIRCRTDDGVVMNRLQIEDWGSLRSSGPNRSDEDAGQITVQGCSGEEEDVWRADQTTEDVTVHIERDSNARTHRITFVAKFWFGTGDLETIEGSLSVPFYNQ